MDLVVKRWDGRRCCTPLEWPRGLQTKPNQVCNSSLFSRGGIPPYFERSALKKNASLLRLRLGVMWGGRGEGVSKKCILGLLISHAALYANTCSVHGDVCVLINGPK